MYFFNSLSELLLKIIFEIETWTALSQVSIFIVWVSLLDDCTKLLDGKSVCEDAPSWISVFDFVDLFALESFEWISEFGEFAELPLP